MRLSTGREIECPALDDDGRMMEVIESCKLKLTARERYEIGELMIAQWQEYRDEAERELLAPPAPPRPAPRLIRCLSTEEAKALGLVALVEDATGIRLYRR
jgi:hypothetical protein